MRITPRVNTTDSRLASELPIPHASRAAIGRENDGRSYHQKISQISPVLPSAVKGGCTSHKESSVTCPLHGRYTCARHALSAQPSDPLDTVAPPNVVRQARAADVA